MHLGEHVSENVGDAIEQLGATENEESDGDGFLSHQVADEQHDDEAWAKSFYHLNRASA